MGELALVRALEEAPVEVKAAALRLYKAAQTREDTAAVTLLLTAPRRAMQRRRSDQVTDARRRSLAGARLPRETVQQYRQEAKRRGLSMYAWIAEALEAHYQERGAATRPGPATPCPGRSARPSGAAAPDPMGPPGTGPNPLQDDTKQGILFTRGRDTRVGSPGPDRARSPGAPRPLGSPEQNGCFVHLAVSGLPGAGRRVGASLGPRSALSGARRLPARQRAKRRPKGDAHARLVTGARPSPARARPNRCRRGRQRPARARPGQSAADCAASQRGGLDKNRRLCYPGFAGGSAWD